MSVSQNTLFHPVSAWAIFRVNELPRPSRPRHIGDLEMRNLLLAAIAATTLASAPLAWAGEANNDPFPPAASGVITSYSDNGVLQGNSAASTVETANSLPAGALDGTSNYAQAEHLQHYWAERLTHQPAVATVQQPAG
jgi:hypothetical protein